MSGTTKKRPAKPFTGKEGKTFTSQYQPSAEAKKRGWQELRKQRILTREVIKHLIGEDGVPKETLEEYVKALVQNAKAGNPKAIDAVNKCIEDDIIKVAQTNTNGEDVPIVGMIIK